MKQKVVTSIVIALLIFIVSVFAYLKISDIELPPVIPRGITHQVHPDIRSELKASLATSGDIIGFRIPPSVSWERGETGSFVLGIKNKYNQSMTFFFTIKLESEVTISSQVTEWIVYPRKKTLPPSGIETIDIIANPLNPNPGTYVFRIIICESPICEDITSPSLYATTTFSFRII